MIASRTARPRCTWMPLGMALAAASAAFALGERDARATDCSGTLASTCINDDTLWPHAGASRFVGFGGTETVASGAIAFGLVTTYLSRPIVIHTPSPGPGGTDQYAINDQVNGNFLWAYGVTDRLELDVILPITFGQGGTGVIPITGGTGLQDTAMRDLRLGIAYAIVPRLRVAPDLPEDSILARRSAFGLTARMEVSAPTGDRAQFAGERSAVLVPSVAGDYRRGRWFVGGEVGFRVRPTTELVGARIGTQAMFGVGLGYDILARELLTVVGEARALPTFAEQHDATVTTQGLVSTPNGSHITPAEWSVSLRTAPLAGGDLAFQLGGGGGIPLGRDTAPTTPRFRFTLGIRYAPMARDTDGDGVLDKDDKCPREAAQRVPGQPFDGCAHRPAPETGETSSSGPAAPVTPLHLVSPRDACMAEPEAVDGFRDDDGCPDEDSDKDGVPNRYDKCPLQTEDFAGMRDGCPDAK
jgi:OOP family OmpA-OmpF porin